MVVEHSGSYCRLGCTFRKESDAQSEIVTDLNLFGYE